MDGKRGASSSPLWVASCELDLAGPGADAPTTAVLQLDLLVQDLIPGIGLRRGAIEVSNLAQKLE